MARLPFPDHVRELLRKPNPAVVTTLRSDGSPVSVATWYLLEDDDRVLLNMDHTRARVKHLQRDPRVSLTVLDEAGWYTHVSLIGRVVDLGADPDLAGIDRLARHYTGDRYRNRESPASTAGWRSTAGTAGARRGSAETAVHPDKVSPPPPLPTRGGRQYVAPRVRPSRARSGASCPGVTMAGNGHLLPPGSARRWLSVAAVIAASLVPVVAAQAVEPTDVITRLAGTGQQTMSGDSGPAAAAALNLPRDTAIGPDGSIYVADTYNQRIRRIDPATGIISTVAGTGGLDLQRGQPARHQGDPEVAARRHGRR